MPEPELPEPPPPTAAPPAYPGYPGLGYPPPSAPPTGSPLQVSPPPGSPPIGPPALGSPAPGISLYGTPPYGTAPFVPPPSRRPIGVAIVALILGILAMLVCWLPYLGIAMGLIATVLAIVALARGQSLGLGVTGLVLGGIALLIGIVMTVAFSLYLTNQPSWSSPEVPITDAPITDEPTDLTAFATVSERDFALLLKAPDDHVGEQLIISASIYQFDAATGSCGLLAAVGATPQADGDYADLAAATSGDGESDCPIFDPLVEGDNLTLWVTVNGSFTYENVNGGSSTVASFDVVKAEPISGQ